MQVLTKVSGRALEKARTMTPNQIIERIKAAELSGRGGAAFPTGIKWESARASDEPRILVCNADEGEPGTFKDRFILENNPELLIEGIHIACFTLDAKRAYIYLRQEYQSLMESLKQAIDDFQNPVVTIEIVLGAGAYICGEETAAFNSIEGKRGYPRKKPPYPTQKGLWGQATCINNVETLADVPLILDLPTWNMDLRIFSISGDVEKPGVYQEPISISLGDLVDQAKPQKPIKAISFGAAGGIMPYIRDVPMTAEELAKHDVWAVRRALVVIGESRSIVDVCRNIAQFFVHESCGKCFPCREGTEQIFFLLDKIHKGEGKKEDLALLRELGEYVTDASFCGLGQTAFNHVYTGLKYFGEEFEQKCR